MKVHSLQISLRLLLVTGETSTFIFEPSVTSKEIIRHVYTNWPVEWEERTVDHPQFLQLLYQGKFLSQSTTLSGKLLSLVFVVACKGK